MNHRILIVDDDKDHAESIADLLQLRGYDVEVAYSGEQAVELFKRLEFDVTVMDVKLPGMNGVEAFFQIRRLRLGAQIIMMTGLSVEELIARAVENGAAAVLRKPFAMGDLINALSDARPGGLVLVADRDPTLVEAIADLLRANGYRTAIVRTGDDIICKPISGVLQCLIIDPDISILSGIEVYLKLREEGCLVPMILVSACDYEVPECLAKEQILIKPFNPSLLVKSIKNALEPLNVEAT
jgi:two-component system response regulator HydG